MLFGCPLTQFKLYINDGLGGASQSLVGTFEPHVNQYQLTSFTSSDTSKQFIMIVEAFTSAGSI